MGKKWFYDQLDVNREKETPSDAVVWLSRIAFAMVVIAIVIAMSQQGV